IFSESRNRYPTGAMPPNRVTCERCRAEFECSASGETECWCVRETYRLPMPLPLEADPVTTCLCPSCLRAAARLRAATPGSPGDCWWFLARDVAGLEERTAVGLM